MFSPSIAGLVLKFEMMLLKIDQLNKNWHDK
jgi:hypothetical protein